MNLKVMLSHMLYEERIELITKQIQYYESLKLKKYYNNECIDNEIDYYKKVLETIKIWK